MSRLYRYGPLLAAMGVLSACGSSEVECLDDRTCPSQQRCVFEEGASTGLCAACDPSETPYNGVDDDCDPRTRDVDLDGDGDNAEDSPFNPGGDCNDDDPAISSNLDEVCGDSKDNDCDGMVDERDCADMAPPTVRFLQPMDGDAISGQAPLRIQIDDDVGAVELIVEANNIEVGRQPLDGQTSQIVDLTFSATSLVDGEITLEAVAIDTKGTRGSSLIRVVIDNMTPPDIQLLSPMGGQAYGGILTIEAMIDDPSGVMGVQYELDQTVIGTSTGAPYRFAVDTSTLTDGAHEVLVRAADTNGSETTRRVAFDVDNTPPSIQFGTPISGAMIRNVSSIVVTASDASSIQEVFSEGNSSNTSPLVYDFDTAMLPNGPYLLTARARDFAIVDGNLNSGNVGTTTVDVVIDNIDPRPQVVFTAPSDGGGVLGLTTHTVDATSLVGATINEVRFFIGGQLVDTVTSTPWETRYDYGVLTGTIAVSATAIDDAGMQGTASIVVTAVRETGLRVAPELRADSTISATDFATGDVDGDGLVDLVTAGGSLGLMRGEIGPDGEYRLRAPERINIRGFVDVEIFDIDGDGDDDIIGIAGDTMRIIRQLPGGMFDTPTLVPLPQAQISEGVTGDLDGDGDQDLVVFGGSIANVVGHVYLNQNNTLVFAQDLGASRGATAAAIGDIDGDGDQDVAFIRDRSPVVSVFLNAGPAQFGAAVDRVLSNDPTAIAIGELSNGGPEELVAAYGPGIAEVLTLTSTQPFTLASQTVFGVMPDIRQIELGQVQGSPDTDIVFGSISSNTFQVVTATTTTPTGYTDGGTWILTAGLRRLSLVDYDNDNDLDIFGTGFTRSSVAFSRNAGNGRFLAAPFFRAPFIPLGPNQLVGSTRLTDAAVGNVLGSANPEVVATLTGLVLGQQEAYLGIYEYTGGLLQLAGLLSLPTGAPLRVAVGGMTPDGLQYIVAVYRDQALIIVPSAGGNFGITTVPLSTGGQFDRLVDVEIGDPDNDGAPEAVISANFGSVVIDLDVLAIRGPFGVGADPRGITIGNFDHDPNGLNDYVVVNRGDNNLTMSAWNGTGWTQTTFSAPLALRYATAGNVTPDNLLDVVGIAGQSIFVAPGDLTFGFGTPQLYPAGSNPDQIAVGDFNGSGLTDAATFDISDSFLLLMGRPQGGFFEPTLYTGPRNPVTLVRDDLDGDGRDDLIIVNGLDPFGITLVINDAALF